MVLDKEALKTNYSRLQSDNESARAQAAGLVAEKLVHVRVEAFKGEFSKTARALLALWNIQRKRRGLPKLELRDFGPEVAVSGMGISPER